MKATRRFCISVVLCLLLTMIPSAVSEADVEASINAAGQSVDELEFSLDDIYYSDEFLDMDQAEPGEMKANTPQTSSSGENPDSTILAPAPTPVPAIPKLTLVKNTKLTKNIGEKFSIAVTKADATGYTSSAPAIAEVNELGVVSPLSSGKAKIVVTLSNKKKVTLSLTVVDPSIPTKITLNKKGTITMDVEESLKLDYSLTPSTADPEVSWTSSKPSVATVDEEGVIRPVKAGTTTITAKTFKGGITAKLKVKVADKYAPKKVIIREGKKLTIPIDAQFVQLNAETKPANARKQFTWSSSKPEIASVDKNGKITLHAVGKTKITVISYNGKKASITINVSAKAQSTSGPASTVAPTPKPTTTPKPTATPGQASTPVPSSSLKIYINPVCYDDNYNQVGKNWEMEYWLNNSKVQSGSDITLKVGDKITAYVEITERDKYPDVGSGSNTFTVTEDMLKKGCQFTIQVQVKEGSGRYAGNICTWHVKFEFM